MELMRAILPALVKALSEKAAERLNDVAVRWIGAGRLPNQRLPLLALLLPVGASGWITWALVSRPSLSADFKTMWWLLGAPAIAVCAAVALLTHRPGTYRLSLTFVYAFWYLSMVLMLGIVFTAGEPHTGLAGAQNLWQGLAAMVQALPLLVFALLAERASRSDPVPLSSPLARLAYLGRYQHLRSLVELAQARGWQVTGPDSPNLALYIKGQYIDRPVTIESGVRPVTLKNGRTLSFFYVRLTACSRLVFWPLFVGHESLEPEWIDWSGVMRLTCGFRYGKPLVLRLLPPSKTEAARGRYYPIGQLLDTHADLFIRKSGNQPVRLETKGHQLVFELLAQFRLRQSASQVLEAVAFLMSQIRAMEECGLYIKSSLSAHMTNNCAFEDRILLPPPLTEQEA